MSNQQNKEEYQEVLIDNFICNRRFHIYFDPEAKKMPEVSVECPHCGATIFDKKHHPIAELAREENLVKSPDASHPLMKKCYLTNK